MLGYCEGTSAVCPEAVENGTADSPNSDSRDVHLGTADNPRQASDPGRPCRNRYWVPLAHRTSTAPRLRQTVVADAESRRPRRLARTRILS